MDHSTAPEPIPVVVIAGPTGTGKSALAVAVAMELDGIVINADSRQVYADFPIVTAQPDSRDHAHAPHRLYGFLPTREKLGAGAYAALAREEIAAARRQGKLPVIVGGTGLYLRTLLAGIAPIPPVDLAISRRWQDECKKLGSGALHSVLEKYDPESAGRLHPNDSQRITRALEVLEGTGHPLGYWHSLPLPPSMYRPLSFRLALSLEEITPRLEGRIQAMLDMGAVEEARNAHTRCPDPAAPGWSGIGCPDLFKFIAGQTDMATCRSTWMHNTRAYAKRQITWFKREKTMTPCTSDDAGMIVETVKADLAEQARRKEPFPET